MSGSRYVPISPARLALTNAIGLASYLHDFLVDRQTDREGRVFYGHAITYQWILANWPGNPDARPTLRSLQRYMWRLKRAGLVEVRIVGKRHGMRIRLVDSVKWPAEVFPQAVQLSLFAPAPVSIRRPASVGKVMEKLSETGGNPVEAEFTDRQKWRCVSPQTAKNGGVKQLRKEQETPKRRGDRPSPSGSPVDNEAFEERRRVLRA